MLDANRVPTGRMGGSGAPVAVTIVEAQCGKWNDDATAAGTIRASQIGEVRNGTRKRVCSVAVG
jgi:hypothetical protein